MKKIFFLVAILSTLNAIAQKDSKIVLKKGQIITAIYSTSADTDMGMGMAMKNSNAATNILTVIADEDKNYRITNTTTKFKMSMDMMGQQTNYDSEKPEDKDSDIGKGVSEKLNNPDTVLVDKITGAVVDNKKDSPERPVNADDTNPLAGMFSSMGGDIEGNVAIEGAFFILPAGKKVGDNWTESIKVKDVVKVKNYTVKSIENNIATIILRVTTNGEGITEMQGNSVSYTMSTKSTGEMTVDIKKGLVNKNSSDIEISGTIEVMGQSMPITSKGTSSVVYQY